MEPYLWGPSLWVFLHLLTMEYPDKPSNSDILIHSEFLNSLSKILPCQLCRDEFSKQIKSQPLNTVLGSKKTYIKFMFDVHNDVNKRNFKPAMDYDDFIKLYENLIKQNKFNPIEINNKSKQKDFIIALLLTSIIGYTCYKIYTKK